MNELTKEKVMTTKEVAEQLGTSSKVVLENGKKCLPNKVIKNGKPTYWTEAEVTVLIEQMKTSNSNQSTFTGAVKAITTTLTPALMIKQAFDMANKAYQMELENLKAKNLEVVEENGQLKIQVNRLSDENKQLEHALEYDKVKDWKTWSHLKKQIEYKGSFQKLVDSIPLIKDEDYAKKVMGNDKYPTTLISADGEEKIIDYKECVLDEE